MDKEMAVAEEHQENKNSFFEKVDNNILVLYLKTFLIALLGQMLGGLLISILSMVLENAMPEIARSDVWLTAQMYLLFIGIWIVGLLCFGLVKKNASIVNMLRTTGGNNLKGLLLGTGIGFGMNAVCVLAAWLNKDIFLQFDSLHIFSLLFVFVAVFIQSSAEELVCRGYLYQKLLTKYKKPWVAIVGNSLLFALLHLGNTGVTVLSVVNIFLSGVIFSLMVYYLDSIWCAFAAHAAWNYTQNIIFGLPNSGIVVPFSVFQLDASTARDSLAYNVGFGIEGTASAVGVMMIVCLIFIAYGRKKQL